MSLLDPDDDMELVVATVLIAFIMVFAVLFNAPLGAKANQGLSPNPTKAPWYFAGIQELFLHIHPLFAFFFYTGFNVDCPAEHPVLKLSK